VPQSILTNTTIATSGRIINVALGVVATALIARLLGPSSYGAYILLLSFGTIVQLTSDLGLYLTLTRDIAQQPNQQNSLLSQIISLRATLLITVFTIATIATAAIPSLNQLTLPFVVIAFGLSFQSISQLFMGVFQHHRAVWRATVGDLIGRLIQLSGIIIIGSQRATVGAMVAVFTIGTAVTFLAHHYLLPHVQWRPTFNWSIWKKIIRNSWPLGAMLLINAIYFRIDTLILSLYRSSSEVGWYGAAYRIVESGLFFPAMLGGLLLPRISESFFQHNTARLRQYINEGIQILLLVASFCLVILLSFNNEIILLIAGRFFSPAAPLLKILSLALVIMFFGNLFGFTLVAMQRQLFLLKLYISLAIFNIITNVLFIPPYGAPAAAWTTVITELLAATSAAYVVHRSTKFTLSTTYLIRIVAVMVICSLLLNSLPDSLPLIIQLTIASVSFLLLSLIARTIKRQSFALLRSPAP